MTNRKLDLQGFAETCIVWTAAIAALGGMPAQAALPYDAWSGHRNIIMNTTATGANIAGDVKKYPVAVQLTDSTFDFSKAKPNRDDIRFADAMGAALPYEIESWDAAAKKAAIWVRTDVKANDKTQFITLYWGNAEAASESDGKKVFDVADGFLGVWHLAEKGNVTAGGYKDATSSAAHATGVKITGDATADG